MSSSYILSNNNSLLVKPLTITSVNSQSGDLTGVSGSYKVYTFTSTSVTYTINYNCLSPSTMYILTVAGGGATGEDQ